MKHESRFGQFVAGRSRPLMAMIEVTNRCNMACPVCFSDANHSYNEPPLGKIRLYMERLLEITEIPIPLQISGGEPTLRKDLPEIVALAKSLGYSHIELITNGIAISQRPDLLQRLKLRGLSAVYLQFDGLKRETYLKLRARDMTEVRRKAIEAARQSALCCTLAVTVARGINDSEIGDVVRFGIDNIDTVRAINFQSATRFNGRFELAEHHSGYSLSELVNLIETQTGVPAASFRSEHMGHPFCNAMSLVYLVNGKLEPLFNYINRDLISDFLGGNGHEKILDLFCGKREFFRRHLSRPKGWKMMAKAAPIFGRNPITLLSTKQILLFAKSFMDYPCLDPERVNRCCYGITGERGVFSLCAFNNLYRFPDRTFDAPTETYWRAGKDD
ncbi:MAG: radical SAM protein [Deltaproteobacteria bacterium]|nr:radical SAM protein [Deltaproteobacteria bacterium]